MLENELYAFLKSTIEGLEPQAGIPNVLGVAGVPLIQNWQPTQQGTPSGPFAAFKITHHHAYGSMLRQNYYDEDHSQMLHSEMQQWETTFTMYAMSPIDPNSTTELTPGDIAMKLKYIVNCDSFVTAAQAQGLGVERVTDIRPPYFSNSQDRFVSAPNFDFVITHKQIVTNSVPVLQSEELDIYSI